MATGQGGKQCGLRRGRTWSEAAQAERLNSLMEADAIPGEVAELAAVWHRLPAAVRAGIVAMVRLGWLRTTDDADDCQACPWAPLWACNCTPNPSGW